MELFRFIPAALLVAGFLPCAAQSPVLLPSTQSSQSMQSTGITPEVNLLPGQGLPCVLAVAPGAAVPSPAMRRKLCSWSNNQKQSAIKVLIPGKGSTCYAIRDYEFEIPKGSESPILKSYSTCVPATRFEAKNVVRR